MARFYVLDRPDRWTLVRAGADANFWLGTHIFTNYFPRRMMDIQVELMFTELGAGPAICRLGPWGGGTSSGGQGGGPA